MIAEIIGPAGSGKTTLSKAITERIVGVKLEIQPDYRRPGNIPYFVQNTAAVLPALSRLLAHRNKQRSLWPHYVSLANINGWHQVLKGKSSCNGSIRLLDQGPVYMIAYESIYACELFDFQATKKYWDRAYQNWAGTLDLVFWLDASLPILVERVCKRDKEHGIKSEGNSYAAQFIESYRHAYQAVVTRLATCSNTLKVIRLDTGSSSLEECLEVVANQLVRKD